MLSSLQHCLICHSFRCTNEWCQTLVRFVFNREFADKFQLRSASYMSLRMKGRLASVQNDITITSCFNMGISIMIDSGIRNGALNINDDIAERIYLYPLHWSQALYTK